MGSLLGSHLGVLDYSELIDEEYAKKREAVLKFTEGDKGHSNTKTRYY